MNLLIRIPEQNVDVTTEQVAKLFCDMDAEQQAHFFNEVATQVKSWKGTFSAQMWGVANESILSDNARTVMASIGTYAWEKS